MTGKDEWICVRTTGSRTAGQIVAEEGRKMPGRERALQTQPELTCKANVRRPVTTAARTFWEETSKAPHAPRTPGQFTEVPVH